VPSVVAPSLHEFVAAVESGINVADAAINYRFQRSERSIGAALVQLEGKGYTRDQLVLCTKAGYLTPDRQNARRSQSIFFSKNIFNAEFFPPRTSPPESLHCSALLAGSDIPQHGQPWRQCIDVFYLHNPETQLGEISKVQFLGRIREAFYYLESAVRTGKIHFYGVATWNGFRQEAPARDSMQLAEL